MVRKGCTSEENARHAKIGKLQQEANINSLADIRPDCICCANLHLL